MTQSLKNDAVRALSKQEIDCRIDEAAAELSGIEHLHRQETQQPGDAQRPRWIDPAELVRRLRPFIGPN